MMPGSLIYTSDQEVAAQVELFNAFQGLFLPLVMR
jgi:hypothetical protein